MPEFLVLDQATVKQLLDPDDLMVALRAALIELSAGRTSVPPRVAAFTPAGLLGVMPGYLPGSGLAVKLVSVFDDNAKYGLPSHQAVIGLFDPESGLPLALMDGTYITAIRTAASAAVAAVVLASPGSKTLTILGAGVQGHTHIKAFSRSLDLEEIRVASRNRESASELADQSSKARVVDGFESAVRGADIVCCCTNAEEPVIRREWLAAGAHVSSVGRGAEIDQATIDAGTVFVEWQGAVTNSPPAGAAELQGLDPATVTELGEVLSGRHRGRTSSQQITVYKSTGHAVEDVAAANLVYSRAKELGLGTKVVV